MQQPVCRPFYVPPLLVQQPLLPSPRSVSPAQHYCGPNVSTNTVPNNQISSERHPNAHIPLAEESILPCHPLYLPNMAIPQSSSINYGLLHQKKKEVVIERITSITEQMIKELSSKGKFLPDFIIKKEVIILIQRETSVNIQYHDIIVAGEYSKRHGRIEQFIKVYCMFTPISTLHDLGIVLARMEGVNHYDDLLLGPLVKHPRIKDYFKPPEDIQYPPAITLYMLHNYLRDILTRSKKKISFNEYLEYVCRKQNIDDKEHLCIRICSFPLMIQVRYSLKLNYTHIECTKILIAAICPGFPLDFPRVQRFLCPQST